ncbi:MAG: hypothetical protein ABSH41_04105 [Syntrophobacteraceae bacterium]
MREWPLNPPSRFNPSLSPANGGCLKQPSKFPSRSLRSLGALLRFGPGSGNSIEAEAGGFPIWLRVRGKVKAGLPGLEADE